MWYSRSTIFNSIQTTFPFPASSLPLAPFIPCFSHTGLHEKSEAQVSHFIVSWKISQAWLSYWIFVFIQIILASKKRIYMLKAFLKLGYKKINFQRQLYGLYHQKDMETEEILFSWLEKTFGQGHSATAGVSISSPNKPMPATSSGMKSTTGCPSTGWILMQSNSDVPNFGLLSKNRYDKFTFFPLKKLFKRVFKIPSTISSICITI